VILCACECIKLVDLIYFEHALLASTIPCTQNPAIGPCNLGPPKNPSPPMQLSKFG